MSAADSLAKIGGGTKNLAIGLGVLAAVVGVGYLLWKSVGSVKAAGQAAGKAYDYLSGSASDATLGTDLYGLLNPAPNDNSVTDLTQRSYFDPVQAQKTCAALHPPGSAPAPAGSICAQLGF